MIHGSISRTGTPPDPRAAIIALERTAAQAVERAKSDGLSVARSGAPGSLGGENMTASAKRTATGWNVEVGVRPSVRWRAWFPEQGTGVHGPFHKPIRRRKKNALRQPLPFVLPSGARIKEFQGQRAQRFMRRNRDRATAAAARAFERAGLGASRRLR